MSIKQLNIYGADKVQVAVDRLQAFEPKEGYYLCFSGGKDSSVIKALADMAGVAYDAHYNCTGIDPPEAVRFIKEQHPDVEFEYPYDEDGKRITMWDLITENKFPPTRRARYCCQELKEYGGVGRFVITGVRWAESYRRKSMRNLAEEHSKSGKRRMSTDNVSDAPMFRFCYDYHKKILNPIIDWANEEVWEFIKEYNVPYCELYDRGFKRIGCIGCPMSTKAKQELDTYPKIKKRYLIAFDKMLEVRREEGLKTTWKTAEEVMDWWLGND